MHRQTDGTPWYRLGYQRVVRILLSLQDACSEECRKPGYLQFLRWAKGLRFLFRREVEINLRLVGKDEMCRLNRTFRGEKGVTDVLSFRFSPPPDVDSRTLGDVIVCCEVVNEEIVRCGGDYEKSWARVVIHGILHLVGFDHQVASEASRMEQIEDEVLEDLGFPGSQGGG